MKSFVLILSSVCFSGLAFAQPASQANELTPKVLAEMLQTASTFHDLVQNLNKSLGPDVHVAGPNGTTQHAAESGRP